MREHRTYSRRPIADVLASSVFRADDGGDDEDENEEEEEEPKHDEEQEEPICTAP